MVFVPFLAHDDNCNAPIVVVVFAARKMLITEDMSALDCGGFAALFSRIVGVVWCCDYRPTFVRPIIVNHVHGCTMATTHVKCESAAEVTETAWNVYFWVCGSTIR